jgi:hypothetical protein
MRAVGAMVIFSGFVVAGAFFVIYWIGYQAKRVTNKQGRQEIKTEVSQAAHFIATDKDFHKEVHKEFKGTYIVFGLVALALIASALGLG